MSSDDEDRNIERMRERARRADERSVGVEEDGDEVTFGDRDMRHHDGGADEDREHS